MSRKSFIKSMEFYVPLLCDFQSLQSRQKVFIEMMINKDEYSEEGEQLDD